MTEKSILPVAWEVPAKFRSRLGASVGRQRPMLAEGHLLLVLHAPPKAEDDTRSGRFFWRTPEGTWKSNELGSGISALNKHLDQYEEQIAALDRQEERAKTAEEHFEVLEQVAPLHRASRNLHQVLQEARHLCPDYRDIIDLRDRAYGIERVADLLFNGAKNSLDYTVARRAEEQAQASHRMAAAAHRLNILAAFFFPIITITAILGVDFATVAAILGIDHKVATTNGQATLVFLGTIVCGLIVGGILIKLINRPPPTAVPKKRKR